MVRRADMDNVDIRVFSNIPIIRNRHLCLNLLASLAGSFHIGGSDMGYAGPKVRSRIIKGNRLVRIGVHLTDKPETENADGVCFHNS